MLMIMLIFEILISAKLCVYDKVHTIVESLMVKIMLFVVLKTLLLKNYFHINVL